jgi:ATP-binding cassette subfamily B protein
MSESFDFEDDDDDRLKRTTVGHILRYLWTHWSSQPGKLAGFLVFFLIGVSCDLALPVVAAGLVTALTVGPTPEGTAAAWAAFSVFASISFVTHFARNIGVRFWLPFASRNMFNLVRFGFADVQRFSADWHANNFAGATVRRVSRAMWAYDRISDIMVWFVLPALCVLTGLTIMMALRWPLIGGYVACGIGLFFTSTYLFSRFYIDEANRRSNSADTAIGAALADAIGSNAAVKSFGAEKREQARFERVVDDWRAKATETWTRFTNAWIVQNVLMFAMQAGIVGLVILEWRAGRASAGDATFAITSYFMVSGYLHQLGEQMRTLQKSFAEIEDVVVYKDTAAEVVDQPNAPAFAPGAGEIKFEHVAFKYKTQDDALYRDFSLTIKPGETVALVGPTGSGKSTFVKLVQRLYDVDGGAIVIDGQDVRAVQQESLRSAIALVPQDPALFHRPLVQNIAYAQPEAPMEKVIDSAQRARAHDFIMRLPKGYDTEVGERGVKLSGGERQRVALARAFLADAPILILDEATSSLDVETERDVQAAMAELKAGRTTIVIAHRLSTIRAADRILVFDQGRIVEQGKHLELIEGGGLYARLHALSSGDKLTEAAA